MSSDFSGSEDERAVSEDDKLRDAFLDHIDTVQSAGTFATFGEIEKFVLPGISIDPVGLVRLPLSQEDADALIQISRLAAFGDGSKTVVDTSIRRTWEIDGTAVNFLNPQWQSCLEQIVESVAEELGIPGGSSRVEAEFYKALLYEPGAMFKAHKDTEKVPGMFGTLVICLPSEHLGGAVCLTHGKEQRRLDTSGRSAFAATYLAWYADVFHEIEPVQSGYRWVLTYNLVKTSHGDLSASTLDARIHEFSRLLTTWEELETPLDFLAWPLEHKYTNKGLTLALLKGNDFYRARHAIASCAAHGRFYCFLANMELCVTDNQDEEENLTSKLYFTRVVDPDGFNLLVHKRLNTSRDNLLLEVHDETRDPDVQQGGGFMGNQHAEIDQLYQDSVMMFIPESLMLGFLTGNGRYSASFHDLVKNLMRRVELNRHSQASKDFLFQICESALGATWSGRVPEHHQWGAVATAAAFLRESSLFVRALDKAVTGLSPTAYFELGRLICFPERVASQRDMASNHISEDEFIRALKRDKTLHKTYDACREFEKGFVGENPGRDQMIPKDYINRWLDSIIVEYLNELQEVCEKDASAVVRLMLDRKENDFSQNILYQSVRALVNRFLQEQKFITALAIELLIRLPEAGSSARYLYTLLQQILDPVISKFDLEIYANYTKTVAQIPGAGPFKALYESACELQQSTLLDRLQETSLVLPKVRWRNFFPEFLKELIDAADTSTSEVQECVQSLVDTYSMQTVGREPAKPTDWLRSEEVFTDNNSRRLCSCIRQLNEYLKDPKAPTMELSCEQGSSCNAQWNFYYLEKTRAGNNIVYCKTQRRWEEVHKTWEREANDTIKALRLLPSEQFRQCLGHRYDEIMDLRGLKVDSSLPHAEKSSVIPKKRTYTDD